MSHLRPLSKNNSTQTHASKFSAPIALFSTMMLLTACDTNPLPTPKTDNVKTQTEVSQEDTKKPQDSTDLGNETSVQQEVTGGAGKPIDSNPTNRYDKILMVATDFSPGIGWAEAAVPYNKNFLCSPIPDGIVAEFHVVDNTGAIRWTQKGQAVKKLCSTEAESYIKAAENALRDGDLSTEEFLALEQMADESRKKIKQSLEKIRSPHEIQSVAIKNLQRDLEGYKERLKEGENDIH